MSEELSDKSSLPSDSDSIAVTFSVFSLNCWGLKWISRDRSTRFKAISAYLKGMMYDFVFLQEVWISSDYQFLVSELQHILPYSRRFESGVIGSGLCVFSKVPIRYFFFIPYQANGYFYKVWHGDWFSGKGVAICQVVYKGVALNLLSTHTHVETEGIEYVAHRVTQALCLIDVINLCLECADLTILVGDLNTAPNGPFFNLLSLSGLCDCKIAAEHCSSHPSLLQPAVRRRGQTQVTYQDIGGTCGLPTNNYTSHASLKKAPSGWRLDYILYKLPLTTGGDARVRVLNYSRPLANRIPLEFGADISYSDHEAVAVKFLYECSKSNTSSYLSSRQPCSTLSTFMEQPYLAQLGDEQRERDYHEGINNFEKKTDQISYETQSTGKDSANNAPSPIRGFHRNRTRAGSLAIRDYQLISQSNCVSVALNQLELSISTLKRGLKFYVILSILLLILLLATLYLPCLAPWATVLTNLLRILLSLIFFVVALVQPIHIKREIHTLEGYLQSLRFKSNLSERNPDGIHHLPKDIQLS